eukprot:TRINITY_DN11981_c0_g1_i1.p1 TRINITY_DN11981_c0_g1~~TRINITY_DN11981_c0_g1_i1.p1  ORF type:complete len:429 (-),score=105.00 TRINITY_DN11981_c0_g1_i1:146-1375(-)
MDDELKDGLINDSIVYDCLKIAKTYNMLDLLNDFIVLCDAKHGIFIVRYFNNDYGTEYHILDSFLPMIDDRHAFTSITNKKTSILIPLIEKFLVLFSGKTYETLGNFSITYLKLLFGFKSFKINFSDVSKNNHLSSVLFQTLFKITNAQSDATKTDFLLTESSKKTKFKIPPKSLFYINKVFDSIHNGVRTQFIYLIPHSQVDISQYSGMFAKNSIQWTGRLQTQLNSLLDEEVKDKGIWLTMNELLFTFEYALECYIISKMHKFVYKGYIFDEYLQKYDLNSKSLHLAPQYLLQFELDDSQKISDVEVFIECVQLQKEVQPLVLSIWNHNYYPVRQPFGFEMFDPFYCDERCSFFKSFINISETENFTSIVPFVQSQDIFGNQKTEIIEIVLRVYCSEVNVKLIFTNE